MTQHYRVRLIKETVYEVDVEVPYGYSKDDVERMAEVRRAEFETAAYCINDDERFEVEWLGFPDHPQESEPYDLLNDPLWWELGV